MQLQFSPDELNLLADILLNQGDPTGILDRVMVRDLRLDADGLDQLRDLLITHQQGVHTELANTKDAQKQKALQDRRSLLESMVEKVSEACAML